MLITQTHNSKLLIYLRHNILIFLSKHLLLLIFTMSEALILSCINGNIEAVNTLQPILIEDTFTSIQYQTCKDEDICDICANMNKATNRLKETRDALLYYKKYHANDYTNDTHRLYEHTQKAVADIEERLSSLQRDKSYFFNVDNPDKQRDKENFLFGEEGFRNSLARLLCELKKLKAVLDDISKECEERNGNPNLVRIIYQEAYKREAKACDSDKGVLFSPGQINESIPKCKLDNDDVICAFYHKWNNSQFHQHVLWSEGKLVVDTKQESEESAFFEEMRNRLGAEKAADMRKFVQYYIDNESQIDQSDQTKYVAVILEKIGSKKSILLDYFNRLYAYMGGQSTPKKYQTVCAAARKYENNDSDAYRILVL